MGDKVTDDGAVQQVADDAIRNARRLCFFAHYHPRGIVADYVLIYLRALADAGFTVVVLSTAALPQDEQARLRTACALLVMRENVGLDFGGWMQAYQRFMPIRADLLLFANDSVYAPFGDLAAYVDRLTSVPADFYGAVESDELGPHLQSWFLVLRPSAYNAPAFQALMAEPIPPDLPKTEIIRRYEWGLTRRLTEAGLRYHATYGPQQKGPIARRLPFNPNDLLWHALIVRLGIPFLKIELLRDNPRFIGRLDRWRALALRGPPALAQAIDTDLTLRSPRAAPTLRDRLIWSVTFDRVVYWPELHSFVVRESVTQSPVVKALNARAFGLVKWVSERVRWRIRAARRDERP